MLKIKRRYEFSGLEILFILIFIISVIIRFFFLDRKIYWTDEVFTSLRISGYVTDNITEHISGRWIQIRDLIPYQQISSEHNWFDTIRSLREDSSHPPLYFVFAYFFAKNFGSEIWKLRCFSGLTSLCSLPLIYFFTKELFNSTRSAYLSVLLLATSPFFLIYSQEARHYSLWAASFLLSSLALLQAIQKTTTQRWLLYTLSLVFSLLIHHLAIFVAAAQGIYLIFLGRFRRTRVLKKYALYSFPTFVVLTPILLFGFNFGQAANFTKVPLSIEVWVQRWIINLSTLFFDPQILDTENLLSVHVDKISLNWNSPEFITSFFFASLVAFTLFFTLYFTNRKARLFIVIVSGFTVAFLLLPDIILGGQRATIGRYLLPFYLCLILCMSYFLSNIYSRFISLEISHKKISIPLKLYWGKFLVLTLVCISLFSCLLYLPSETWWNKYSSAYNYHAAQVINEVPNAWVISSSRTNLISLSYELTSDTKLMLANKSEYLKMLNNSNAYSANGFLYKANPVIRKTIQESGKYNIEPIPSVPELLQIVPKI